MNATRIGVRQKKRRVFFGPATTLVNPETGERIEAQVTTLTGADTDFKKFWIGSILAVVDELSNAKMKVVWFLLDNVSPQTNRLHMTVHEIAHGSKVSVRSVMRTLQALEKHDIIRRRFAATQQASKRFLELNPNVMMTGSVGKRQAMLIRFQQLELPIAAHDEQEENVIPIKRRRAS